MNTLLTYLQHRKGRFTLLAFIAVLGLGAYVLDLGPTVSQEAAVVKSDDDSAAESSTELEPTIEMGLVGDSTDGGSYNGLAVVTTGEPGGDGVTSDDASAGSGADTAIGVTDTTTGGGTEATATTDTPTDSTDVEASRVRTPRAPRYPGMYPGGGGSTGGGTGGTSGTTTVPGGTTPTPDVTGPITAFVDALDGTTTTGSLSVRVTVTDPVVLNAVTSGVREVGFVIDGTLHATTTATSAPGVYTLTLDTNVLANGVHTFGAYGVDTAGNRGATSTASVTVANPVLDTTAPTIAFAAPFVGTTTIGTTTLTATALDPEVAGVVTSGVAEVAFMVDGTLIATTSTTVATNTYAVVLNTLSLVNGEHVLSVRALDAAGNISQLAYATTTVLNIVIDPGVPNPFVRGGVSLTFDDANASQYQYVFPLLKSYGQTATLYVPTGYIDTTGYMTWGQIGELKDGGWEIGGHTVNHAELPLLADSAKEQEVADSLTALEDKGFMATSFATPFGAYDPATIAIIAESYDSHRNFAHLALNKWPYNKYFLQIERVTSSTTPAEIESWVDQAIAADQWLIVVFHEVQPVGAPGDEWSWTTENLAETLNYLQTKGVKTKTVADMLKHGDNLVENSTFAGGLGTQGAGWWTNNAAQVTLDSNKNGSYPEALNSIKFEGNPITPAHLFSPLMDIDPAQLYGIRFYVNAKDFVSGELGFYIDEYDAAGTWISGKWLGQAGKSWVIDESYPYTATSASVAKVGLQVYMLEGSIGTAYIDSVEFFKPE